MEDDADAHATLRKDAEEAQDLQREPSARPTERRILNQSPAAAPAGSHLAQLIEGRRPAALGPRDPRNLQRVAQRNHRFAQIPAIIANRIDGLVALPDHPHDPLTTHPFTTTPSATPAPLLHH